MPRESTFETGTAEEPFYVRREVTYGRKFGMALTMDVFSPRRDVNGAAIIFALSEGWYSDHSNITRNIPVYVQPFIAEGYTVFAVCHGSNLKFSLLEIPDDLHRSVRFIRHHVREYAIDPGRIGITGDSAGAYLSLMLGCTGGYGNRDAFDPVDRESSRVQAVVAYYPPTDFLSAFDFYQLHPETNSFELISDLSEREQIGKMVSPISHVKRDNAPTLIIHGDADVFIPLQQSEVMAGKLKGAGVPCELIIKAGGGHDEALVERTYSQGACVVQAASRFVAKCVYCAAASFECCPANKLSALSAPDGVSSCLNMANVG